MIDARAASRWLATPRSVLARLCVAFVIALSTLASWVSPAPAGAQPDPCAARARAVQSRDLCSPRSRASKPLVRVRSRRTAGEATTTPSAASRRLRRGLAHYRAGDYARALGELRAAAAIAPSPRTLFYLARSHEAAGDAPAAESSYATFLASAPRAPAAQRKLATERLEALRAPRMVEITSEPAGAEIVIDGQAGWPRTPAQISLAPGRYALRIFAPGHVAEARELEVTHSAGQEPLLFTLQREAQPEPVSAAPLPVAPDPTQLPPRPFVRAVRTSTPPTIDGRLADAAWRDALPVDAFTQKAPYGGQAPTEHTSLRLLYDDVAIYVAVECEQRSSPIVALLARRDRPIETDSVSIAIDSRLDGRSAFEFSVSAAGVLGDGMRFDDGRLAREWDATWEARTERSAHGWSAELRIPLHILRFEPVPGAHWGLQARRYISARQETAEWAYIPRGVGGEVTHYGRIEGLGQVPSSQTLELQPFVVGRVQHQTPDPALVRSGFALGASAGLDFKWHLSNDLALDGTINPDFGQVEADRLILNLSTVQIAFPEKRPFFLAGMDDFVTLTPIFYSRRIGRTSKAPRLSSDPARSERLEDRPQPAPIYTALKLTGDLGSAWTVAALSAVTGPSQLDLVAADGSRQARLLDPLTSYNVLRVRNELAPGLDLGVTGTATLRNEPGFGWPGWLTSNAGHETLPSPDGAESTKLRCPSGALTDRDLRCSHDAYVGSLDLVWRSPAGQYAVRAQAYGSAIANGPMRMLPDGTQIGAGDLGAGSSLRLSKQGGEHWLLDATIAAHSRKLDFDDLGSMERQNQLKAGAYVEYRTLDPWLLFMETHTSALAYGENNLNGLALGRGLMLMEDLVLESRWTLSLGGYAVATRFDDREVGDGTALERAALLGAVQAISTDPRRALVISAQLAEEQLSGGSNFSAQLGLIWHVASMAELQVLSSYTYNFGELRYAGIGESASELVFGRLQAESASVTLRASYAFSPTLTLQSYAQLFLASGSYFDFARLAAAPERPRPTVRTGDLVASREPAIRPDFQRASLSLNLVLRWEYQLGSTLYLLYLRSQDPDVALDPTRPPSLGLGALRSAPATDVLMVKLAYWIG